MAVLAPRPLAATFRTALAAPTLLLATGGLLAVTVLISKLAADRGADMLWFLFAIFAGAGSVLAVAEAVAGRLRGAGRSLPYAAGAGLLAAGPSAMGYLAVGHVGAGYLSLAFAFPVLLTYLLALPLGLDRASPAKVLAVAAGLAGGAMLAAGKSTDGTSGAGWLVLASAMPFLLAAGNVYRTLYWPRDAAPGPLAALTLLAGAAAALPVALAVEGAPGLDRQSLTLAAIGAVAFAAQYLLLFRLQRLAGPVYLSQIGAVAAVLGAGLAVAVLGESLPDRILPAALLIAAGIAVFQAERARGAKR